MLGREQQETLFYFFSVLRSILAESHTVSEIGRIKEELNVALALLEKDFPISIQACISIVIV